MSIPQKAKAGSLVLAGLLLGAAFISKVVSSVPGDTTYGIKEAAVELRTALAPSGEERSSRYLDEVDLSIAELALLARQGAPKEKVAETAERAITTERHAQAELSDSTEPETVSRYRQHRRTLQSALRNTNQPAVRQSVRKVLKILPVTGSANGLLK